MEIVDFSNQTFKEIPQQDNPAFISAKEFNEAGSPNGCILITKQDQDEPPYKNRGRFIVMKINAVENPLEENSVEMMGLFWSDVHALNFANSLIKE